MASATPQTVEVLRDAAKVFDPADDVQTIESVVKTHAETKDMWAAEHERVVEALRGLTEQLDVARENAANAVSEKDHRERIECKENEKFLLAKQCRAAEEACIADESVLRQRKTENASIQTHMTKVKSAKSANLPKLRYVSSHAFFNTVLLLQKTKTKTKQTACVCVCVCVCMFEGGSEVGREVCVCVCVRERERESVCVRE